MSDQAITALQRNLAASEVERLRLVGELEEMRIRAEQAEARIASVSGMTREQLVAAEREACAVLVVNALRDGIVSTDEIVAAIRARGGR